MTPDCVIPGGLPSHWSMLLPIKDVVTIWKAGGSDGQIETALQQAIDTVEEQLQGTGLRCSPAKSELLILPPPGTRNNREAPPNIKLKTKDGTPIPQVKSIRVLGMYIDALRHNGHTLQRLNAKITTAMQLIRKVATRYAGMRETSLLRLVQSFAVSHVAYVAAYHNWKPAERQKIDALIRKVYKTALGLYTYTNTEKLLDLGVHNTLAEIAEAQRTTQFVRLTQTKTGRAILARIGYNPPGHIGPTPTGPLPLVFSRRLRIPPLPKHMHPDANPERRLARAKALTKMYAQDTSAYYVDAAPYPGRPDAYAVAVISAATGALKTAASIRTTHTTLAEEFAIALALTQLPCTTILSDSRLAILRFATNQLAPATLRICTPSRAPAKLARLAWFPAHTDLANGGTGTLRHARLPVAQPYTTPHVPSNSSPPPKPTPLLTYALGPQLLLKQGCGRGQKKKKGMQEERHMRSAVRAPSPFLFLESVALYFVPSR
ncbi:hypothetical protein HPB48_020155 [Haemaphysalis longicornis]|uniref:Tick transposon n=1 Tax=Haemaphysalis longicornis TaxID=44386 RepID=A0A9J6FHN9_HAELO|nr:hypothetical protein HPB48_020155 [Haemaphysalis longicornis]